MRIFRIFLQLFIILALPLCANAQRPAYYKMSPMVREACRNTQWAKGLQRVKAKSQQSIIAFVKLTDNDTNVLTDNGCKVLAQYGKLCIAEIPLSAIGRLSEDEHTVRIEAERGTTAMMDTTGIIVNAVPVQHGIGLPQGYTGKGVVVGVQDIGFDLTHPTFYSSDMSQYRIKAMWDQLSYDTLQSSLPVGRDYVGQEELLKIQHPRDGIYQTHGTHTTGIAAGSGAEGNGAVSPYKGIAYDADICLVCNATSNDAGLIDPKDYYKYTYALDALGFKYIFDYADRVGKPCVINFSEGSSMDFRGDDQLYYEMLDSLTGPGHIIVSSSGNNGANITYVRKVANQQTKEINCNWGGSRLVYVSTRSKSDFTFCAKLSNNGVTAQVEIPLEKVLSSADSTYTDSISGNGFTNRITATAYRSCYDPTDIICDWEIDRDSLSRDGGWTPSIELKGDNNVEMFPVSGSFYRADGSTSEEDNFYSVLSPGSAPSVISVGFTCYRKTLLNYKGEITYTNNPKYESEKGERMMYSSVGPTFDERIKPDVMAPGQNIVSSYSSFYYEQHPQDLNGAVRLFEYNNRNYGWQIAGGSSMAAPVVTGIIALWLQANPKLTPEDCIDIFSKTCTHYDPSLSYPNNYYGYGQIDAEAGMKLVLQKSALGINEIQVKKKADDRIFTIDGRYLGRETATLPHGIYIRGGKKFVK